MIKSSAFLFTAAIRSHWAHSWLGLNYNIKLNIQHLGMNQNSIVTFLLQQHLAFLKDFFSVFVSFAFVAICILVSSLGNSWYIIISFSLYIINFPFIVFIKN